MTEIIKWASEYLQSHGYKLKNSLPEIVRETPWSYVCSFDTDKGYIYLKQTPELIANEANIIRVLREKFHASVAHIIAHNSKLNCFLMYDAGDPLRQLMKQQFDVKLMCKTITQFTSLQIAVADHINIFFDLGVPDWRLDKLPNLYQECIDQKDILLSDGLSEYEVNELKSFLPTITALCKKLSDFAIKPSIVQPDFNDNNNLINDAQKITLIDIGEITISHPFFSINNFLHQTKNHYGLSETDDVYLQMLDACFQNYLIFENIERLREAFATIQDLWFAYAILGHYYLMNACGIENILAYQPGKLCNEMRTFIKTFKFRAIK